MYAIDVKTSKKLYERQWGQCAMCGDRLKPSDRRFAHKLNDKNDKPENSVMVCKRCTKKVERSSRFERIPAPIAWKYFPFYNGPKS